MLVVQAPHHKVYMYMEFHIPAYMEVEVSAELLSSEEQRFLEEGLSLRVQNYQVVIFFNN